VDLDVDRVSVAGSWWRHAPHGSDPLWLASPPSSGRWQQGTTVAAVYFADDEEATVWAEWYRLLAEAALPPTHGMPRDLWRWAIAVGDIADLSTTEKLARLHLPPPVPSRRSWGAYQAAGARLRRAGYRGVLYPSAARRNRHALCLFRDRILIQGAEPVRPPATYRDPPPLPQGLRT
jgi:RES domain-containing protein